MDTTDLVRRLRSKPEYLRPTPHEMADYIERLEERCAAYKGQVEYAAALEQRRIEQSVELAGQIERLTKERDAAFRLTGCECEPDECCRHLTEAHGRADTAEATVAALRQENERLRQVLTDARETILDLKNARWSEVEGTDAEYVADIDAALKQEPKT